MHRHEPKLNRRYKQGQEFYYDYAYESETNNSRILNDDYQAGEMDGLLELKEKRLQMLQNDLELLVAAQKLAKQTAINKGGQWIEDGRSREKRVRLEAQMDVVQMEIEALQEAIEDAQREKERHDKLPVLPYGPQGLNQVRGSTGSGYCDGMWSKLVGGIPVIVDERPNPYRGMAVADYIEHVAKPYVKASQKHNTEMRKKFIAEGKKDIPVFRLPNPEWPKGIKNHLNNTVKPKPKMVRTK